MKYIKRLICWWKGHDIHACEERCERCGRNLPFEEAYFSARLRLWYWWNYDFKRWFKRNYCTDCGKPYNKKNDHSNCCPF